MIFYHNRHNGFHYRHNSNVVKIVSIVNPIVSIVVKENGGLFLTGFYRIIRIGERVSRKLSNFRTLEL